jgi:hypothetical protein
VKPTKKCRECNVVLIKGSKKTTPKGNCYPSNMQNHKRICNSCLSSYYKNKRNEKYKVPYIKRKTSTIPFGYELSEIDGYLKPVPDELKILYVAHEWIKTGISLEEAAFFIKENTNKKISKVALWKQIKKNNLVKNLYDLNIEKLKRNCKICDKIYFHSPVGTKVNGTGKREYCSKLCKRTNTARQNRIRHLYKMLNNKPKKGFIYCITNPSFEGWVKVGKALNLKKRLTGFNGSTPYRNFKVEYKRKFENYSRAEYFLLCKLNIASEKQSSEWFKIDLNKAIDIIKNYQDIDITPKNIDEYHSPKSNLISNLQRVTYY